MKVFSRKITKAEKICTVIMVLLYCLLVSQFVFSIVIVLQYSRINAYVKRIKKEKGTNGGRDSIKNNGQSIAVDPSGDFYGEGEYGFVNNEFVNNEFVNDGNDCNDDRKDGELHYRKSKKRFIK